MLFLILVIKTLFFDYFLIYLGKVGNGKPHQVKCQGDLSTAYFVVKSKEEKFVDSRGNHITSGLCGNGELNAICW